jgi:hypothetical protein
VAGGRWRLLPFGEGLVVEAGLGGDGGADRGAVWAATQEMAAKNLWLLGIAAARIDQRVPL